MEPEAWGPLGLALALAVLPLAAASPLGLETHVAASERPGGYDYVVEEVVVDVEGRLVFTNADLRAHDVVSHAFGPSTNPWCGPYPLGRCPLFASPLIGLGGQALVEGTDQLTPLASYTFYCTTHDWMTGTLTAV